MADRMQEFIDRGKRPKEPEYGLSDLILMLVDARNLVLELECRKGVGSGMIAEARRNLVAIKEAVDRHARRID